jgi:beta-glucosidase
MKCEQGCGGELNITNELKNSALNTWQTMSIDLTCFAKKGVDFARVTSPFIIKTAGELSVSVADISFKPQSDNIATVKCE